MIYADFNATYPCSESHLDMVSRVMKKTQGNPSSIHQHGREARLVLEESREQVARLIGAQRHQLFFTSGATEANNLALQGVVGRKRGNGPVHVVLSSGEHPSLLQPAKWLESVGLIDLSLIRLKPDGKVCPEHLIETIRKDTAFVGLILANNETGIINPLDRLIAQIRSLAPDCHIHSDGVQAYGKTETSWIGSPQGPDSFSASAHKIGGFKGIGFLYLNNHANLQAMMIGGGQEQRVRSGTENMPGVISFGLRAREILACQDWLAPARLAQKELTEGLKSLKGAVIHGDYSDDSSHTHNTVNFHVNGLSGETMMLHFDMAEICVSSGSACSSGQGSPSPVLMAMGYDEDIATNSVRVSFGHSSSPEDAKKILSVLRQLS